MRRLLVALALTLLSTTLPATLAHAQSVDCAKPAAPAEKAVCDDATLLALDRLVARGLRFALEADPAGAAALRADQQRWLATRDAAYTPGSVIPLIRAYELRLRALLAKTGARGLAAAIAAAAPIDPLHESTPQAEENAAFVAFVLTTLHPQPAPKAAGEDGDVLSTYDLYSGFTFIAPLPDGRLFVAVPESCGAYQCATIPFLLDRRANSAVRLAVEMPDAKGMPRPDPKATRVGILGVANGQVDIFEQGRGQGDCGTHWVYRVDGTALALVKRVDKPDCDGKEWTDKTAKTKVYR